MGGCLTWDDWVAILAWVRGIYNSDQLPPVLLEIMTIFQFYLGLKGKSSDVFGNTMGMFWPALGMIFGILIGSLAGAYAGYKTITYAVKVNYWTNGGAGHSFYYNTQGDASLGGWLGFFESGWVVAFMAVAVGLIVVPYLLAMELETYLSKMAANSALLEGEGYRHSLNGLVLGVASWGAAWVLAEGGDNLIGWFDTYDSSKTTSDSNYKVTSSDSVFMDVLNHTLLTLFYGAMAFVMGGSAWWYVYAQYTDPDFLPKA